MAGIAGIIFRHRESSADNFELSFKVMLDKLAYLPSQLRRYVTLPNVFFGNVVPINDNENYYLIENNILEIYMVLEGLVYISHDEKELLINEYNTSNITHDHQWLPWLYHHYGNEVVNKLTGWYNLFFYDQKTGKSVLFNDRLGYLPLYIYESESYILFSSRIEALLASGLMKNIEFDPATFAEHLFFNYPLSENTYIKNISTLSNANIIEFKHDQLISKKKYWNFGYLFGQIPLNESESFDLITSTLKNAVHKGVMGCSNFINFSLTGGWDSRVILSFLLPELRYKINAYSFGAVSSDDIIIPQFIANKEQLNYTPYILDINYLSNSFTQQAVDTIILSNGTRGYKRAHYLYAIREVSKISEFIINGIFGDEVFKVAQASGGEVLSLNTIELLESNFNVKQTIEEISKHSLFKFLNADKSEVLDILSDRLLHLQNHFASFSTINQKYYVLRFEYNLRKYFGYEMNSYNDFAVGFSPFIDYDFLDAFSKTSYFATRFRFNAKNIFIKKQSTRLYYEITNSNHPALTRYNSSRGYSMMDSKTVNGQLKIIFKKFFMNKALIRDGFNTKPTDQLFLERLLFPNKTSNLIFKQPATDNFPFVDKLNSLYYWVGRITSKY